MSFLSKIFKRKEPAPMYRPLRQREAMEAFIAKPLISVVLPVYNGAETLKEAISSVLLQGEVELIIVNDGSTDGSAEVIGHFSEDPRVHVVNQENKGLPAALNAGFEIASGSLLTWTSADNLYLPGALDKLSDYLLLNPKSGLVYANYELIGPKGEPLEKSGFRPQEAFTSLRKLPKSADSLLEGADNFIGACFLYRRHLAALCGSYQSALLGAEDYHYWLRLSRFAEICHLGEEKALYQYRLHPKSLTSTLSAGELKKKTVQIAQEEKKARSKSLQLEPLEFEPRHRAHTYWTTQAPCQSEFGVIPPGLRQASVLKRARDCAYGAISNCNQFTALTFMPSLDDQAKDWTIEKLKEVLSLDLTLALVCSTKSERQLADSLNSGASNLQIFDLSSQFQPKEELECENAWLMSLTYLLSSTDLIVSVKSPRLDLRNLLELCIEGHIAAHAGCPVISIYETKLEEPLLHKLASYPHIAFEKRYENIANYLAAPSSCALDQVLADDLNSRFSR